MREGKKISLPDRNIVIGPGTGLGIAYVDRPQDQKDAFTVTETFGGHMLPPSVSYEQHAVLKVIEKIKPEQGRSLIVEDVVSGPGLHNLFKAVSIMQGAAAVDDFGVVQDMLKDADNPVSQRTLSLFHAFLGLTIHQTAIYAHAFGGVYLDGGVMHFLLSEHLFDLDAMLVSMRQKPVPVVAEALDNMGIYVVTDPFVALRGLLLAL